MRLYGKETPNPARNVAVGKMDGSYLTENLKLGINFSLLGGGAITANRSIMTEPVFGLVGRTAESESAEKVKVGISGGTDDPG